MTHKRTFKPGYELPGNGRPFILPHDATEVEFIRRLTELETRQAA